MKEVVTVTVRGCIRCGQEHKGLLFSRLTSPVFTEGEFYDYVAQCPVSRQRVFMKIVDVPEDRSS